VRRNESSIDILSPANKKNFEVIQVTICGK